MREEYQIAGKPGGIAGDLRAGQTNACPVDEGVG